MATYLNTMFRKSQKNYFLIFFLLILNFFNTSSFAKVNILEVTDEIFILDIYGNRYVLDKAKQIKKGDYLRTRKKPASFTLNDKTKICLSANTSIKILNLKKIDNKIEITLDFNMGDFLLEINEGQANIYNVHFPYYQLNDLQNDIILSKKKKTELINFGTKIDIYSKASRKIIKAEPYKIFELTQNGEIKNSFKLLNLDKFNNKFSKNCNKILPELKTQKNKKWQLQYGCISQNSKLVCGNRYK